MSVDFPGDRSAGNLSGRIIHYFGGVPPPPVAAKTSNNRSTPTTIPPDDDEVAASTASGSITASASPPACAEKQLKSTIAVAATDRFFIGWVIPHFIARSRPDVFFCLFAHPE
jgi:hypothetical protein